MAIIEENLSKFETALSELENATKETRKINHRVRQNLDFEGDLTQPQIDRRLAKITPLAAKLQTAVTAAEAVFQATEAIPDEE